MSKWIDKIISWMDIPFVYLCLVSIFILCSMAWGSAWNLFIYRPIGWTTVEHYIYGLSLCMSECILCACFYCLLSTWALINFSQNALQLNGKLFYAIHAYAKCRTMVQADSHSLSRLTNNWLLSFYIGSLCLWEHNNLYRLMRLTFFFNVLTF